MHLIPCQFYIKINSVKFDSAKENSVIHIPPLIPVTKNKITLEMRKKTIKNKEFLLDFPMSNLESVRFGERKIPLLYSL
jgi:hypothetical protein